MDDEEIRRLRKMIRRTYASQPHKIKCWLALLEMYGERYQVAECFRSGGSSQPLRSIETESGDLENERNKETQKGDGHTNGEGVTRENPSGTRKGTLQVVGREGQSLDAETLRAQRTLEDRRAMSRKLS